MGQGISCTDERSTIDLSQQQQQYQQAPILRNNEGLFIEQQPPEYQEYRGITTTNQYNIVSLNTSQISMQKDAYESHSELSRMPSQISIISELKQHIATEDMNPLSTQVFQKYSESNQKEKYSYMSRNQSKEVLQEIISVPQSMNKPTHRPSSNCKLSTRVKEKLLDKDDEDESLALNFSPSKNYKSNAPQQDVNQSHQSSVYSHTSSNSEYTGFRYLQGGMHQLKEQQFKGSFGLQKQNYHNALQSTLPYKSSNFKAEEQKVSKRYGDDKENRYQEEKYEYKSQTIKTEVLQNLERYRQMNNPIQALHEARSFNKQPNSTAIVPVSHTQVVDKEVLGITSGYHTKEKDELISQVKNSTMLREHRSKSKRNEVSTSRNIPVKKFKEDGLKSKKMQTKSSKKNNRKYSSSSSSSQPSLSSHDSYQENSPQDEFAKYSKGKKSKQSKNDSRQVEKQSRNVLSKKASEQLNIQQTTFNDDTYQQFTAPNSNYNSTQPVSHIQQQPSLSLMEERYSNRSTTNPTQHQNSQFSQQSSSVQQKQTTPNCYGCINQQCNGGQGISSRMNPHQQQQQFPHTCQTKNNLLIDNNNLINRNQSNLSVCQNNSSFNIGVTFPQQQQQPNQLSMYGVPNQQLSSPLSSQYSSTQQQIQQIQHQLIQQQLALAQTQQNHQAQIQNILLQQQQQQQHQAISYIPPYNMMYCSPNQQYLQPQIAQSHIIGNYTNQPMVTPVIDKGNPLMPFYLPHSQQYMPASAVQNKTVLSNISQTNNGIHPEQIDFSNFDKNQLNIYNQQLNPAFPGGQQQQYVIHPTLGNQNQPFPIIINNNVVSPKKNKAKNGFDINDNKNMILSHEITDDKLKNMQSLSFNINSSQNSDDFKNNKKKAISNANNENKFLETSISEIEEKKRNSNGQAKQKNQRNNKNYENDDDDDGFDINIADEDFEEIKGAQTRTLSALENTNANKPLALQTRTNVNAESYRMHTRSSTQDKDTFTFRNQNKNGKNQSLLPNNFEDMIKNTKIANNIQLDDQDEAGLPSSTNNGGGQQKSLAEIFQERRKKLAQKMEGQKRGFSAVQAEEKSNNEQNDHSQLMDDMAIGGQTHQKENKGKRTKDEMIKLRQEMKEYGSRVNPKLKAKTQQKIQAEQEQLNQVQLNGTSRMKSPSYSKKREELMIRLAQGVKPKIDEKEMYALTKKNYDNLPEVKRKRQEQEKLINKQEMLKAKQEKLKELDEKRRGKFKQKSSVSNLTSNKSFSNNYSSTQLIS